jgi:phosphatidylinositol alpha-1,6-mannosyltransferase
MPKAPLLHASGAHVAKPGDTPVAAEWLTGAARVEESLHRRARVASTARRGALLGSVAPGRRERGGVLYVTPGCFDKGGISRYNRYQITALRELLGEEAVRVYSVRGPAEGDFETPFGVDWSAGGRDPERGASVAQKLALVARLAADTLRRRPRLVISAHVNLAALAVALARSVRARSVLDVYGLEVWSGLRRDASWGLRAADLVIADCHFTASFLREARLREARAPVEVLWDCVDTERFRPALPRPEVLRRYGIPDPGQHVNVLTLGRMVRDAAHKGYDRLLAAFSRAAPSVPSLRLVYAGKGELADELRRRAASSGVADRVVFTGAVHEDDLPDVYRSCHVFSLVSDRGHLRGEGIPLAPLEAAACARPILVGDQDGSREAAVDGLTGYVLDPFDAAAHADRLVRLATDPDGRARMGMAARARILEHHDYRGFRDGMARVLSSLGQERPAAG